MGMVKNCGYGRRLWATVEPSGKLAYGGVENPRDAARAEFKGELSSVRSAALLTFSPKDASRCADSAFKFSKLSASSQTPRLPTKAASTRRFAVIWRCS